MNLSSSNPSGVRYHAFQRHHNQQQHKSLLVKTPAKKAKSGFIDLGEEPTKVPEKKGTVAGAMALIVGTSIGSGLLALPQKASQAVTVPVPVFI